MEPLFANLPLVLLFLLCPLMMLFMHRGGEHGGHDHAQHRVDPSASAGPVDAPTDATTPR